MEGREGNLDLGKREGEGREERRGEIDSDLKWAPFHFEDGGNENVGPASHFFQVKYSCSQQLDHSHHPTAGMGLLTSFVRTVLTLINPIYIYNSKENFIKN